MKRTSEMTLRNQAASWADEGRVGYTYVDGLRAESAGFQIEINDVHVTFVAQGSVETVAGLPRVNPIRDGYAEYVRRGRVDQRAVVRSNVETVPGEAHVFQTHDGLREVDVHNIIRIDVQTDIGRRTQSTDAVGRTFANARHCVQARVACSATEELISHQPTGTERRVHKR